MVFTYADELGNNPQLIKDFVCEKLEKHCYFTGSFVDKFNVEHSYLIYRHPHKYQLTVRNLDTGRITHKNFRNPQKIFWRYVRLT